MADSSRTIRALIVDDESDIRELVEITLARMNIETLAVADLQTAHEALQDTTYNLCLTDMRLPDGDGIDLVRAMGDLQPHCPIAVITAYGSAETAVEALKAGAFDFVSKPIDISVLRRLVEQAVKVTDKSATNSNHSLASQASAPIDRLIGRTPAMQELRATIGKLARSQAPVYITGDSGTGKELAARCIHATGPRADADFVAVNCGAIPAELMESEFFGYRKGSFTGADRDREGLVQQADGGTLFLDEVAELPLAMQVKLLRVIQERAVRQVGDTQEKPVDFRIISATHQDLAAAVQANRFREDLFYRLNVIEVRMPALRERAGDIPELTEQILDRLVLRLHLDATPKLSAAALDTLRAYHFPGNIRELENILERAVTLSDNNIIEPDLLRLESPLAATEPTPTPTPTPAPVDNEPPAGDLESQLEELERTRIMTALQNNQYNKTNTAKALGITFRALRYRMDKLGLK